MATGTRASLRAVLLVGLVLVPCLCSAGPGGYIVAWGSGIGLAPEVTNGSKVARVSAGRSHVLVLLTTGELRAYGSNDLGQISIPAAARTNVADISAGWDHSLVVLKNGSVYGFGYNEFNQSTIPAALKGVKVKQVAAGYKHSLALTEAGAVIGWGGSEEWGQATVPAELTYGQNVTAIAAGTWTSIAVLDGGQSLVQWGSHSPLPADVQQQGVAPGPLSVAIGLDHVTALLPDGSVSVWPAATISPAYADALQAVMQVPAAASSNVVAISAKTNVSMALLASGKVLVWGLPDDPTYLQVPQEAQSGVTGIAAGDNFGIAIHTLAPPTPPSPPLPPTSPRVPLPAPGGGGYSVTWGSGIFGLTPEVTNGSNVAKVSAGNMHVLVLLTNGELRAFGSNEWGQIAIPAAAWADVADISAGAYHSLVVLKNGSVYGFGRDDFNQSTVPDALQGVKVKQVAAGYQHSLALTEAGVVVGWGGSEKWGQATVPAALDGKNVTAIAAGGGGGGSKVGIIVGVGVGAVALVAAIAGVAMWWHRKRRAHPQAASDEATFRLTTDKRWAAPDNYNTRYQYSDAPSHMPGQVFVAAPYSSTAGMQHSQHTPSHSSVDEVALGAKPRMPPRRLQPSGLVAGDPFLYTARQLTWTDYTPGSHTACVEAGINDVQLDAQATGRDCPVVELNKTEIRHQLEILTEGLIGKGGSALVFMCRWPSRFGQDALLAVKLLKNAYDTSPSILQTFAYEAKLLASLKHDHVVRLYGYCMELPTVCLIMELLPGSLEDLLYNSGTVRSKLGAALPAAAESSTTSGPTSSPDATIDVTLTLAPGPTSGPLLQPQALLMPSSRMSMLQVLQVCVDVAAGLDYLHNRQLSSTAAALAPSMSTCFTNMRDSVLKDTHASLEGQLSEALSAKVAHRDLKPANILLNSRGRAKLSDFGLARENPTTTVHTVHVGAGTLHYMAPELLASRGPGVLPTNRVDIYSLGIMMWEMVAGQKPWARLNPMQLQTAVAAKKRPTIPDKDTADTVPASNLAATAAGFYAMPGFVDLIRACWRQRDHKRPPASEVHARLVAMLNMATGKAAAGTSWPADKADKDDDE